MTDSCTHTPGPWEVENLTKQAEESWFNIIDGNGFTIAEAIKDRSTARLIATTPALLATVRAIRDAIATCEDQPICAWAGALNNVIAKAEGEQ